MRQQISRGSAGAVGEQDRPGQRPEKRQRQGEARVAQPWHGRDSGSARRTAMIARRGSTVQGKQALSPRRSDAVTADTGRNRVLHDFWRACFLDFTVAL